ncbi:right-handed parallel beta-helix repeat-containing protein [Methanovulcanius yangii]|uniref:right-handed parallel beta-helix repeat-containing protein n=1 Tax=Methanovulcanius yangii TaxID=1789227 RepID=UPI0029C9E727|nr:NosD domain-containing protein [Methanovulcanius yangii]
MKKIGNKNFGEKFVRDRFSTVTVILALLLACGVLVGTVSAEDPPEIEWQRCLGGSSNEIASSVQQTDDGGYIIAGFTESIDGDVTGNHDSGDIVGYNDVWVVKLNSAGSIVWQRCLGGEGPDSAKAVKQTSDGGYIVAGATSSVNGDATGNHGGGDVWLVKLDSDGLILWQRCLGGWCSDFARSVQQTSDGGYIITGQTWSNDGDVTGNHGEWDAWVVKLNSNGQILWQRCLGGSDIDEAYSIQQTSDGCYIVAGLTFSTDGDMTGNHGNVDAWVGKLDHDGKILWLRCLGGWTGDGAHSIQQTADGGYIVAGRAGLDAWVVKLDNTGNIVWQRCLGGTDSDEAYSVQQTSDGSYIVAGMTYSIDGDVTGNHGGKDAWVVKLDNAGNIVWQRCLGGSDTEVYNGACPVQQTSDGGYIVASDSASTDGDVTGNHGGRDFWVVKLSPTSALISVHNIDTGEHFSTIQAAIDDPDTLNGHMIVVDSGTYYENIVVNKQLVIWGEDTGGGYPVIDAKGAETAVESQVEGIVLSQFIVKNARIGIVASPDSEISANTILGTDIGIYFEGCWDLAILDNDILGSRENGILFYAGSGVVISGNLIADTQGIGSNQDQTGGIYGEGALSMNISGNTIRDNGYNGIRLLLFSNHSNNTISRNIISGSVNNGLELDGSNGNQIYLNNFIDNGQNVAVSTSTEQNQWNTAELFSYLYDGSTYTSYLGNYWSDYAGADGDGNGVGDTPQAVPVGEMDEYPLMEQWEQYDLQGTVDPTIAANVTSFTIEGGGEARYPGDMVTASAEIINDGDETHTFGVEYTIWDSSATAFEVYDQQVEIPVGTSIILDDELNWIIPEGIDLGPCRGLLIIYDPSCPLMHYDIKQVNDAFEIPILIESFDVDEGIKFTGDESADDISARYSIKYLSNNVILNDELAIRNIDGGDWISLKDLDFGFSNISSGPFSGNINTKLPLNLPEGIYEGRLTINDPINPTVIYAVAYDPVPFEVKSGGADLTLEIDNPDSGLYNDELLINITNSGYSVVTNPFDLHLFVGDPDCDDDGIIDYEEGYSAEYPWPYYMERVNEDTQTLHVGDSIAINIEIIDYLLLCGGSENQITVVVDPVYPASVDTQGEIAEVNEYNNHQCIFLPAFSTEAYETDFIDGPSSPFEENGHDYQFKNFGDQTISWEFFKSTYGTWQVEFCNEDGNPILDQDGNPQKRPIAECFYDKHVKDMAKIGSCFGMSASSCKLFINDMFGWDFGDEIYADLPSWSIFSGLDFIRTPRDWVEYYHIRQYDEQILEERKQFNGINNVYAELKQQMASGEWNKDPMILIFNNHIGVPYRIEEYTMGVQPTRIGQITISDSNFPKTSIPPQMRVDLLDNSAIYYYNNLDDNLNIKEDIRYFEGVRLSTIDEPPIIPGEYDSEFSEVGNLLYTDQDGNHLGYFDGNFVREVPDAYKMDSISGLEDTLEFYLIDDVAVQRELVGVKDGISSFTLSRENLLISGDISVKSGSNDYLEILSDESGILFKSGMGTDTMKMMVCRESAETAKMCEIIINDIEESQSIEISNANDIIKLSNIGPEKSFTFNLQRVGNNPGIFNINIPITIEEDSSVVIRPDWDDLDLCTTVIEHDIGNDGTIDEIEFTTELVASVDLNPDVINLGSKGNVVTAYIELPPEYGADDFCETSVRLVTINGQYVDLPAIEPNTVGDDDEDDIPDLMVKFDRQVLKGFMTEGENEISILGTLCDGTYYSGVDVILAK